MPEKSSWKLDPPRTSYRLRLVRSDDTQHHLMAVEQQKALLAMLHLPGGDQK